MVIEKWAFKEEENKKKKLTEKQIKDSIKKQADFKKTKEIISVEIEAEEEISHLKNLVKKWLISKENAEKIKLWKEIDEEIIKEIFKKIDEIEDIKNIDNYLPKQLRITHEEYFKALHDEIFRVQMITKLDSALTILSNQINPDSSMWINLFTWFLTVLDKNLVLIQENTIDIKDNLKQIDNNKSINEKWFFKNLKDFFS